MFSLQKGLYLLAIVFVIFQGIENSPQNLKRVKRIIGATHPVDKKGDKFKHTVTLYGEYKDYTLKKVFGFLKINVQVTRNMHCGASLLDNQHVITAAHCLYNKHNEYVANKHWKIYIHGIKRMPSLTERFRTWLANRLHVVGFSRPKNLPYHAHPIQFTVHPAYDRFKYHNDIAIIKIKPINLGKIHDAGPVDLPTDEIIAESGPTEGEYCWYAGWGCTSANGDVEEVLLQARFKIKSLDVCVNTYAGANMYDWKDYLCAQAPKTSICSGDSGGGLVCQNGRGKWYLAGIASSGASGKSPEMFPSNFMKVSAYTKWIKEKIKQPLE